MLRTLCTMTWMGLLALAAPAAAAPAPAPAPAAGPAALKFAIHSPLGQAEAQKHVKALTPILTRVLRRAVTVTPAESNEIIDLLADGKVDAAWLSPLSFVRAKAKNDGVKAVAKALRNGAFFYRSVIFTRKEDAPLSVKDLKGKRIAFVNKSSTSGYLFPLAVLARQGVDPETLFAEQKFVGDHLSVCRAVLEGAADAGATFADEPADTSSDPNLAVDGCRTVTDPAKFAVVAKSGPISNDVIAVRPGLDAALADDIAASFRELPSEPDGPAVLKDVFQAETFGRAKDGDFESVSWALKYIDKMKK